MVLGSKGGWWFQIIWGPQDVFVQQKWEFPIIQQKKLGEMFQTFFDVHPENWGGWTNLDEQIFQRGWFNHQGVNIPGSTEQWNNSGYVGGWNTTQFCGDYFISHEIRIPFWTTRISHEK